MNKRFPLLAIILWIALGLGLRLAWLGQQSLWYDEGVTWLLAEMGLPELVQWTAADIQPPLYYLLAWLAVRAYGDSEWALRFPSVLFNILTLPALHTLARRLFQVQPPGKKTGLLTTTYYLLPAILFTCSPLMVYYSQEARMYTLLVGEATLAGYLLLKILAPRPAARLLPAYALLAAAALYTHYFAAFLLIAHALYAVFILWQRGWPKALVKPLLLTAGLIALLYLPWCSILLSRLGDDPSYWPGALKLNEALRKILISFSAGETVFEQTGRRLALGYLAILAGGGVWAIINRQVPQSAGQQTPNNRPSPFISFTAHRSLFLLLWLLIPPALILLLSSQSPKFNPRYTMLSYPAFVLILTVALTQFLKTPGSSRLASSMSHFILFYASRFLLTLCLLFICSTSFFSLCNWFTDPRFAKDDFKALAQFVRERQTPDETVLLSSGHVFPVWAYYYGWQNWTPLPQMERLNVRRVTDLSIAAEIAAAIKGKGGVWLVRWQDEVIDPNGVVPFWLNRIGRRPLDAGDFWGVGLEHWRLEANKTNLLSQSPIEQPAPNQGYNFANRVDLLGLTQLNDNEIALFWVPRQPLPQDLLLTLNLTDEAGFGWAEETAVGRPGAYEYPPSRWPAGQVVLTRHQLAWRPGTPPGSYLIEVGLGQVNPPGQNFEGWDILDEQGRPQRRTARLGPIRLSHPVPVQDIDPATEPLVDFRPVVAIRRITLSAPTAEPGDRLLLTLLWQAGTANQTDPAIAFELLDAANQTFDLAFCPTSGCNFNLSRRQPGEMVLGQYWLDTPPNAAPGPATLRLHFSHNAVQNRVFPLGHLEILATERHFTPPDNVNMPLQADFSGQTTLLGANCSTWTGAGCRAAPGQSITLTLYWRADALLGQNYTIFTHLLGPAETVIVNADHAPTKPTQGWVTGEIITDPITLVVPATLSPGQYSLEVGLYDAAEPTRRLRLTNGDSRVILPQPLTVK
ncbi:MAG: glycosyltransferase family 39 protein [Anaerolineae bacterium]|nr:glycosyltransferase family 39 protein [Anaerolineae bacterium]